MIDRLKRSVSQREESGQALLIVIVVAVLLIAFSVSLASQSNQQAPIAEQSVLARLATQAAHAGLADYQDFISANPANAVSFCSNNAFTCHPATATYSGTTGSSLPTGTIAVSSTTGFSTSAMISVSTSAGAQEVTCTGTQTSPIAFTGCTGGTGTLTNTISTVTQFEVPGGIDPAFASSFTSNPSCSGNTVTSGWATATISSVGGTKAAYQYIVNSSALQANASGGEVYVYATGRAGIPGNYVCDSLKASFWVQLTEPGVPQTVATNDSYTSIDIPSSCQTSCTTTTATVTVAGGSGGNGGSGFNGTGGTGGAGEEIQATFQIPTGTTLSTDIGYEGMEAANNLNPSSAIAASSNGVSLPTGTINVSSNPITAGFTMPIPIYVTTTNGTQTSAQIVTCDADTASSFTHCSGGSGTLSTGAAISQPWSSGYGTGGASGNPGGSYSLGGSYSSSGSGGGASAVCLQSSSGGPCNSTTPLCLGALSASSVPCVLAVAAGGGGAGEGTYGGSAGNGGNGGNPAGAFPITVGSANEYTTAQAEGYTDVGGTGGSGYAFFGQKTGASGGGKWVPSPTAASNTATGGSAGSGESFFGDQTPNGSAGQPNSGGSPITVAVSAMGASHNGAKGPSFSGDGCLWWCTGSDGGGGGGGLSGGGSGAAGGDGGAGAGAGGSSYFDVGALYTPTTGACSSGPCLAVGTAGAGNGFANYTIQNVSNQTIPVNQTACLNDGQGGSYTPCSATFVQYPNWYSTGLALCPIGGTNGIACNSLGQLYECGTAYYTQAPPNASTGQAWIYGGGGGGGYSGGGIGGNGAAAMIDFRVQSNDFYAVDIGCGGGGGTGTSTRASGGPTGGGAATGNNGGGGGGSTIICFEGATSSGSCTNTTANCPTTGTPTSACVLAIVGGGGGAGSGGGTGGGSATTTWCSANGFSTASGGNCNANTGAGGGTGGASWFATGTTANVAAFSTSTCTSSTITSTTQSCLMVNSNTSYPESSVPCQSESTQGGQTGNYTNGSPSGAGEGCGGASGPTSGTKTGYQAYAGQLGFWNSAGYVQYYGWVNWTVNTPALESGACDFTPPASPWPPDPNSETVSVPNTGKYTLTVGGGAGASGWQTAGQVSGVSQWGPGGSGSEITFNVNLTALQQLTVVAGCGGFGNIGGLGFGNGGSSGFQPQGTYSSGYNSNGTPVVNGTGGGGGGASAICLSNANVTGPTCTTDTPLCTDSSPAASVTCLLAIAGGGGGGGTECASACSGAQITLNTACTTSGSDLAGGGGITTAAYQAEQSFSGTWPGGLEGTGAATSTHYFPGAEAAGGTLASTSANQPQSYSGTNPPPTSASGGTVTNGGNGGWNLGSGIPSGSTTGGIGAGGGGAGFEGGWADPWTAAGQSVPTDVNPNATSAANQYMTGSSGSAAACGAGGGSSWITAAATGTIQTGSNPSPNGTIVVLYDPPGNSQITSSSQVAVYSSTT